MMRPERKTLAMPRIIITPSPIKNLSPVLRSHQSVQWPSECGRRHQWRSVVKRTDCAPPNRRRVAVREPVESVQYYRHRADFHGKVDVMP
ncbi:hypothetical protein Pcinc_023992 [Petrolisthes cinctipes]|uniref:Uncharacterized protein n=1 Tax=Petrolisthes cinctipes TaxID=88211 RepID=A0AAE1FBR5_PETCI|nr:hypothetical protein Pcinc_023992 [Petrolisthes cinctipes]